MEEEAIEEEPKGCNVCEAVTSLIFIKNTLLMKRNHRFKMKEIAMTHLLFYNILLFLHWVLLVPTTTLILTFKIHPFIFIVLNVVDKLHTMVLAR
jgi:hypothetical protein